MRKVFAFLSEVRAELSKVVWPSRGKTFRLSVVVVIVTIAFGAFISGVDFGLSKGVESAIDVSQKKKASPAATPASVPVDPNAPAAVPVPGAPAPAAPAPGAAPPVTPPEL